MKIQITELGEVQKGTGWKGGLPQKKKKENQGKAIVTLLKVAIIMLCPHYLYAILTQHGNM